MSETFQGGDIRGVVVKSYPSSMIRVDGSRNYFEMMNGRTSFVRQWLTSHRQFPASLAALTNSSTRLTFSVSSGPRISNCECGTTATDSETFGNVITLVVGQDNPAAVLIPKGVVHAYQNVGDVDGIVINCPNRLYMGQQKRGNRSMKSATRTTARQVS